MRLRGHVTTALTLVVAAAVLWPAPAVAADHTPALGASILGSLGGLAGGVFAGIGHAVLGAFSWTVGLASKFILTTIAALVHLLIPHSWINKGLQIMRWIVAVPDYAGQVTTPGGRHAYGFAGINALRDLFTWLGVAIAPLTLLYATARALVGDGDPVAIPILRMLVLAAAIVSYPYWWSQAAALADQVTNAILSVPAVAAGLQRLMAYAVGGVALGGWQLIDLGLMGATGLALLALIFLKVVVVLLGALLYATGPLMIGLVPTRAGSGLARAWLSAAGMLLGLGVAWATVFAVGAVLIGDSATAGPLIAGNSNFGTVVGGLLLAVAGVASLWLCLKVAKEAAGLLRAQLAGLLIFTSPRSSGGTPAAAIAATTPGAALRSYGSRLAASTRAAGSELALAGPAGARLAAGTAAAASVGRRGLIGTAAVGATAAGARLAPTGARLMERSPAGALAARMARAGTASWTARPPATPPRPPSRGGNTTAPGARRHGASDGAPTTSQADQPRERAEVRSPDTDTGPRQRATAVAGTGAERDPAVSAHPDTSTRAIHAHPGSPNARPFAGDEHGGPGAGRPNPGPGPAPATRPRPETAAPSATPTRDTDRPTSTNQRDEEHGR